MDEPLQFTSRAGSANGYVIRVSLNYENLHRYCFTCKMISHEERTCPELSEEQKERNRLDRIAQREKEERATRETFSLTDRQAPGRERDLQYLKRYLLDPFEGRFHMIREERITQAVLVEGTI